MKIKIFGISSCVKNKNNKNFVCLIVAWSKEMCLLFLSLHLLSSDLVVAGSLRTVDRKLNVKYSWISKIKLYDVIKTAQVINKSRKIRKSITEDNQKVYYVTTTHRNSGTISTTGTFRILKCKNTANLVSIGNHVLEFNSTDPTLIKT